MKRIDLMSRTTTLLTMLSIVYALIDMNIILLAPILTIYIPYRFMKYKEEDKYIQNRKKLNNLFIFNLVTFVGVALVTNRMTDAVIEIIANILITFIYFVIISSIEKRREAAFKNPQIVYDKINNKINALEMMYKKTEENMNNATDEKSKATMENKLNLIRHQIDDLKRQLELIKFQIESKNNNQDIK